MAVFEIRQCTAIACGLRMPIDRALNQGAFCPKCGAPMTCVVESFQNSECLVSSEQNRKISVLLDNVRSAYNVGAIFRTADGVDVDHIFLCGITPNPKENVSICKTALGSEEYIRWSYHHNAYRLGKDLRSQRYRILALECTPEAIPLFNFISEIGDGRPIVLIIGNERAGVDPALIDLCDHVLALPMAGNKSSLNVAVAFGVAAYWLSYA